MSMTSMKVQKPQVPDAALSSTLMGEEPEYPYGLRICLDQAQLAALGLGELPKVGARFKIEANVVVCDAAQDPNGGRRRLELQIVELDLKDDAEKTDEQVASKIYTVPIASGNGK